MKSLYKTTIIIWSEYDPTDKLELLELARRAENGDCYCSSMHSKRVEEPSTDPSWDDTEFFNYE